ncbi:MAG: Spo0A-C domain-containing protein [Candidatus Midichloria mitochondrii]|uniref:Uncharacterized protein n=1 Tax=Midichloria mitochondrii (strain IricVA) TaxID=696127 RepID=F7XU33_MIDMI|nr:hypothetical protein [Candidatus Midichloria mitochondrii]AEI89392.1 hypothetical protein midi_01115 [Candidatus Midichloria mitochondrii IricVA]MDJ1255945.1 hypothetical protein [Candidatus Midichloria mitochondrii]MDJ1287682.1 hypothetical protein [Candidatus Midichloria mitochondrii]MDJ1298545.1 hypothetical protein [Candidatus Midichloria mitochondrii]MDJ1312698.1 hypothetical protein [Candidatus Midichloria mitochondrii]
MEKIRRSSSTFGNQISEAVSLVAKEPIFAYLLERIAGNDEYYSVALRLCEEHGFLIRFKEPSTYRIFELAVGVDTSSASNKAELQMLWMKVLTQLCNESGFVTPLHDNALAHTSKIISDLKILEDLKKEQRLEVAS